MGLLTAENILFIGSILLFVSILAGKTSFRIGVPTLILFVSVGMLAGVDGLGGIRFYSSKTAQLIGVFALNFILFSGGMETKWGTIKKVVKPGLTLATAGVLITALCAGLFITLITDFTLLEGLLLGSIISSTDAAAVFSILRSRNISLKGNLNGILELESGSNDPMAYFLTISLTGLLQNADKSLWTLIPDFFLQMIIGALAGLFFGRAARWVINRIRLEVDGLYPVLLISLVFMTFSASEHLGGNGFLAVYISALMLGNNPLMHKKSLTRFFDGTAWLAQIILFLTLGLLAAPRQIVPLLDTGLLISLFLILVARPVAVFLSLSPYPFKRKEKLFISWVGLRGAVPIVFATYPLLAGIEKAGIIFNLVFFIAVTSVLLQGTTLSWVAGKLGLLAENNTPGLKPSDLELTDNSKSSLRELVIPPGHSLHGKSIFRSGLPKDAHIMLIYRENAYFSPEGSTLLQSGDRLLVMAETESVIREVEAMMREL